MRGKLVIIRLTASERCGSAGEERNHLLTASFMAFIGLSSADESGLPLPPVCDLLDLFFSS